MSVVTIIPNGKILADMRRNRKLKQSQVEDAIGIQHFRLSLYERNSPIPINVLNKLAKFYNTEPKLLAHPDAVAASAELTLELMAFHGFQVTKPQSSIGDSSQ